MLRVDSDFGRRILRMLVPAALAGGVVALYPAIASEVVGRFGPGFAPPLVALYVAVLVGLFLADSWARDRRLEEARRRMLAAERDSAIQAERVEELRFVLDVAAELDGAERLEAALASALERIQRAIPFESAFIYLGDASGRPPPARRGVWPLTAAPSADVPRVASAALTVLDGAEPGSLFQDPEIPEIRAAAIRERGRLRGVVVLCGVDELDASTVARLDAVLDRLGASIHGLRLFSELDGKERALRHAYRELRTAGDRMARAKAQEEALLLGRAASEAIVVPVREGLDEVRRLKREAAGLEGGALLRQGLDRLRASLQAIRSCAVELRHLARRTTRPRELDVNDAVVAALDLVLPAFKRSNVETRLSLDPDLPRLRLDEALLHRVLSRALHRARTSLRQTPGPRRLFVETQRSGAGAKIIVRDNGGGELLAQHRARRARQPASALEKSLQLTEKTVLAADLKAQGMRIRRTADAREGRATTVFLRGLRAAIAGTARPPGRSRRERSGESRV